MSKTKKIVISVIAIVVLYYLFVKAKKVETKTSIVETPQPYSGSGTVIGYVPTDSSTLTATETDRLYKGADIKDIQIATDGAIVYTGEKEFYLDIRK